MGFSTALSGLNAAAKDLQVTGNNVANANTTGFKESRTEFADVYAASVTGVTKTQAGAGVGVANVAQQFNQGNLNFTNNNLDLAISGQGFFSLSADPAAAKPDIYTRSGEFKINKDGFVVNNQGNFLMSYAPNGTTVAEGFSQGVFKPLSINSTQGAPVATSKILTSVNLDASQFQPSGFVINGVNPNDSATYNHTSSTTTYDSQGNSHVVSTYYVTDRQPATATSAGTSNQWESYLFIDGKAFNPDGTVPATGLAQISTQLKFNVDGTINSPTAAVPMGGTTGFDLSLIDPSLTVNPLKFDFNFSDTSQISSPFSVRNLSQDGMPAGTLTGIDISKQGVVRAQFSNGGANILGQVALTRFSNPQGLTKNGDTAWRESIDSGTAVPGQAGSGSFGVLQSGALESSNVDLSAQLVHLIVAQQAYQANAKSITTEKTIIQTILNA